jgi:hypothetical protein
VDFTLAAGDSDPDFTGALFSSRLYLNADGQALNGWMPMKHVCNLTVTSVR